MARLPVTRKTRGEVMAQAVRADALLYQAGLAGEVLDDDLHAAGGQGEDRGAGAFVMAGEEGRPPRDLPAWPSRAARAWR